MTSRTALSAAAAFSTAMVAIVSGQGSTQNPSKHPAIEYATRPTTDPVTELNKKILDKKAILAFEPRHGYLRAVLAALAVPIESQLLVYSETSFQSERITQTTPRALYFNDRVAVGWVKGGDVLEVSSLDPRQGVLFYTLPQTAADAPQFERNPRCLECHQSMFTSNVPSLFAMSMLPLSDDPNEYATGWGVDHRTPIDDRWGGWFVTGATVPNRHLGNVAVYHVKKGGVRAAVAPKLASVKGSVDTALYLTPYSDVVALLVLNHQTQMTTVLTRLNWAARIVEYEKSAGGKPQAAKEDLDAAVASAVQEVVDYMLFAEEAPLPGKIEGSSGFAEKFGAEGPRDAKGRSLRDLDLQKRLLRYPCSYMIYSAAFDGLPPRAKNAVYDRLWQVLSGKAADPAYARLSASDRQAIIEILRDTKNDLPASFASAQR